MAPGLNPNPAAAIALLPKFRIRVEKSPIGLFKVANLSRESHLRGVYDKCFCVFVFTLPAIAVIGKATTNTAEPSTVLTK